MSDDSEQGHAAVLKAVYGRGEAPILRLAEVGERISRALIPPELVRSGKPQGATLECPLEIVHHPQKAERNEGLEETAP